MRRRAFVRLAAGATLAVALPVGARQAVHGHVLSAWAEGRGVSRRYFAGRAAASAAALVLPARGHGVLRHPARPHVAYVCARRPGEYLLRFDTASGTLKASAETDDTLRFEGHAVLDASRNRLLATQSELDAGEGRIGIFDADSLERLGEWPTHGIGPHEIAWAGDGVLAVANGGILTLPETGRIKRNLDTMEPSLVLLDARDGRRLAQHVLPERRLGIRHLALAADGVLGVALQHEGSGAAPVLALWRNGHLATAQSASALVRADGYGAAVAAQGNRFAVTCPRGDAVLVWDREGRFCGEARIPKPAGIAALPDAWVVSNELGELWHLDAGLRAERVGGVGGRAWDNHLAP